ncbi:MAG: glycoside hydrolase family 2 protein [Anaerolineae bacterium]
MNDRSCLSLDGQWFFQIDRDEKGEERGYHLPSYQSAGWLEVHVPSNWDCYSPGLFGYAGHAWYRRTFQANSEWRGRRLQLRFEGANYETTVWLNGRFVGSHAGGFDPFAFDITDLVDWSGPNILAVRVDNWPRLGRVPNSYGGWWNYGGLYRSVKLLSLPPVRIADVFVRAEPRHDAAGAPLWIDVTVANDGSKPVEVRVGAAVALDGEMAPACGDLSDAALQIAPGATARVSLAGHIGAARLWSPDAPNLYTLGLTLAHGDETLDAQQVAFGVRRFEVRGTQLLLNGEPIILSGFNRHEEYAGTGRVDPGGVLEADLRLIKELGGNMVRMHYQAHPELYNLADRLGLLVFAEIPAWGVGNKDVSELTDPKVLQTAETMLRTLIGELKNHPSVVIWSIGNESATNRDEARPFFAHLAGVARSLDTSRPIAYVGMFGPEERCYDLVDLPCTNQYFGRRFAEFGQRLDDTHALAPDKPLLVAEFGHESVYGLHGEGYGAEEEHAEVLEGKWQEIRKRDYIPGGLIWCLADYWHMPMGPDFRWLNRVYFCHGAMSLDRRPKAAVEATRRMWEQPARMVR